MQNPIEGEEEEDKTVIAVFWGGSKGRYIDTTTCACDTKGRRTIERTNERTGGTGERETENNGKTAVLLSRNDTHPAILYERSFLYQKYEFATLNKL